MAVLSRRCDVPLMEGLGVRGLGQPLAPGMWIQGPKVRVLRSELGCKVWGSGV